LERNSGAQQGNEMELMVMNQVDRLRRDWAGDY
jgi:hypothetical protein